MAEEGCGGGSWLGGWVQAAKEKTSHAYEFMKKDLTEFTTTVGAETTHVAESVKNKITQENVSAVSAKAKQGVSSIIGGISKALVIEAEDLDDPGIPIDKDGVFDRKKARLRALQLDSGTYLNEPSGTPEQFEMWLPSFDLDSHKGNISELLVANVEVRALYTQLVPSQISHACFWQRYYYKVHQLEQDEERKRMLMKRADNDDTNDDLAWDDDEDFSEVAGSPPRSPLARQPATTVQSQPSTQTSQSSPPPPQPQTQPDEPEETQAKQEPVKEAESSLSTTATTAAAAVSLTDSLAMDSSDDTSSDSLTVVSSNLASSVEGPAAEVVSEAAEGKQVSVVEKAQAETKTESERAGSDVEQADEIKSDSSGDVAKEADFKEFKTKEKGEMVVVGTGSERTTPSTDSVASSNAKESSGLDDDWEQDFDVEVSEEDLKLLEAGKHKQLLKDMEEEEADDWENWE